MARQGIEPSRGGDRSFLLGTGEHDGRDQDRRRSGARRNNSVRRGVILKTFAARPFSMFVTIVSWILRRALALASASPASSTPLSHPFVPRVEQDQQLAHKCKPVEGVL